MTPGSEVVRFVAAALSVCVAAIPAACTARSAPSTPRVMAASAGPREIRELTITPSSPSACPGQIIAARYFARTANGSRVTLGPSDLSLLARAGVGADPTSDGGWQTNGDPMASVFTGFRLTASLLSDSTVRADTVVVPSYECRRASIGLRPTTRFHTTRAHVRLGVMASPLHDSIVVAVVEVDGGAQAIVLLTPREMRPGAIKINAPGIDGAAGRNGRPGRAGADCSDGEAGEDGEPGGPGEPGGQVDIIVQADARWLADLVVVSNLGGRGGAGGSGGAGGRPGISTRPGRGSCTARPGRNGRPGHDGGHAASGPAPRTTSVIFSLLWPGSPVWSNETARRALEQLTEYDQRRRR